MESREPIWVRELVVILPHFAITELKKVKLKKSLSGLERSASAGLVTRYCQPDSVALFLASSYKGRYKSVTCDNCSQCIRSRAWIQLARTNRLAHSLLGARLRHDH